jgi:hypothetical protein
MVSLPLSLVISPIDWGEPSLRAAVAALSPQDELLVVFDGLPHPPPHWLIESGATLLYTGGHRGAAAARQLAAARARYEILLFIDADVEIDHEAVNRVRQQFHRDPSRQSWVGSYDATPVAPGLGGRQVAVARPPTVVSPSAGAGTLFPGYEAVRRDRLLTLGRGNGEAYRQPHEHGDLILPGSLGPVGLLAAIARRPLHTPIWLKRHQTLAQTLARVALALLALLALAALAKGLLLLFWRTQDAKDIYQRFDEWRLFRDQIYPSGRLASPEHQALPYFRTTVYLPWALPLFGLLFAGGGLWQGKVVIFLASLAALALMSRVGWYCLRPWGPRAGWLGALSCLAIPSNASCLAHGQFAIMGMGLITLQWLLLNRQRPKAASLCWVLAMVKPQIAATYALPFLRLRWFSGLLWGSVVLLGLSAAALAHTHTAPMDFLISWLQTLSVFVNKGNINALGELLRILQNSSFPRLALLLGGFLMVVIVLAPLGWRLLCQLQVNLEAGLIVMDALHLAGVCGLLGMLGFYHYPYDNIMLYPALLACWRDTFLMPCWGNLLLALALAASLWTPQSLLDLLPGGKILQTLIWLVVTLVLLGRLLKGKAHQPTPVQ